MTKAKVICCGHAAYDLNFMMDEYPVEDRKYAVDKLVQTGGGPAANAASLLAIWGAEVAYAGLIGDDIYGRLIVEELQATGVDTSLVQIDATKDTPLSAVIVNQKNGSRTLLNRRNASDQPAVTGETVDALKGMHPEVLHFDGHALDLSLKMIELFPNAKVVIDSGSYRDATDRLCRIADYAICSQRFAELCTGIEDFTAADSRRQCMTILKERYPGRVIVTLGADGFFYEDNEKPNIISVPAIKVEAVDTTGAGDIFHGAFSYGLLQGYKFEDSLQISSAAAALSVLKPGGRTSIPVLKKALNLAGNYKLRN